MTGSVGPVQDEVSLINGNKDGLAACGARQYRIIDEAAVSSFFTIDQTAQEFTLESTEDLEQGQYTIEIEVSLVDYPEIKE